MDALDEIEAGLLEALGLERELGVRLVEIDRALLAAPVAPAEDARRETRDAKPPEDARREMRDAKPAEVARQETRGGVTPLVFLHDRALSPGGVTMMAKAIAAMHLTPETAPILFTGTRPAARVTVVLGLRALRHWFPGAAASPGQWISPDGTPNVLVTYSPDHILRFGAETPAVRKMKLELWTALKGALQRLS